MKCEIVDDGTLDTGVYISHGVGFRSYYERYSSEYRYEFESDDEFLEAVRQEHKQ